MIKFLHKNINFILNLGITDALTPEKVLRFKLVNLITFLSATCDFIFIFIAKFYLELNSFAIGLSITLALMIGALFLMNYKKCDFGRIMAIFASMVGGLSAQYFVGAQLRVEVLAFIQIIYVSTFFTLEERKLITLGSLFAIIFLALSYGVQFNLIPHHNIVLDSQLITSYNFISTFAILSLVGIFLMCINKEYFKARNKIAELNKNLERNLEVKKTLNKIVVHDLATPLMLIKGLSDRLLSMNTNERKEVEIIYNAASNIENILKNVKKMMADVRQIKATKEKIILSDLFSELVESVSSMSNEKKIIILAEVSPRLFLNSSRGILLNNILINLVTNAIKFSEKKSTINVNAYEKNGDIEICILDSGSGMTKEQLESIYSFELNKSSLGTSGEKGTGYGLPIVKFSVDILGGQIEARNRTDSKAGIEFILTFPIS